MIDFLSSTGWTFETMPTAYGLFHILFTVIGLGFAIFFAVLLRKSSNKTYNIIMLCLGAFLVIAEVYKLTYRYFISYNQNISSWMWLVPFQLCSVPMYLVFLLPFLKEGKLKTSLYTFLATFTLATSLITFVEPSGFLHAEITLTVHAFLWHIIIFFIGTYTMLNKGVGKNIKQFLGGFYVFLVMCSIATVLNLSLNHIGGLNMFYISPLHTTPIIVFKDIQANLGYPVAAGLYVTLITLIAFVTFAVAFMIYRSKKK